jgi:transcriptional regulator with XRE-family HTH domain
VDCFKGRTLDKLYTVYYIIHTMSFGKYIKQKRQGLATDRPGFSLRRVAATIEVEPSFLSKVERDLVPPPSEAKIIALADYLGEDADILLAMAGKVSSDLQDIIRKRPQLFAELIRQLKEQPDHAVLKLVREVKDGDW